MMKNISTIKDDEPVNSVWMMAHSGARGSAAQIKQLSWNERFNGKTIWRNYRNTNNFFFQRRS